jgi:hypothetical protein
MGQKIVKIDEVEYLSSQLKETLEQQNVHNLFAGKYTLPKLCLWIVTCTAVNSN